MAEEDTSNQETNETQEEQAPQYSEVEIEAMNHGWKPQGEFEDSDKDFLSAKEFMGRQKLYDRIKRLERETRRANESVEAFKRSHSQIRKRAIEDTIEKLKAQKMTALENEEHSKVIDIDDQILRQREELNEVDREVGPNAQAEHFQAVFSDWVSSNGWYNSDAEAREYADMIGPGIASRVGQNPEVFLEEVGRQVKQRFPEKFGVAQRRTNAVDGGTTTGRSTARAGKNKPKHSLADLPEEDREIARTLIKNGAVTEQQYLKDYYGE